MTKLKYFWLFIFLIIPTNGCAATERFFPGYLFSQKPAPVRIQKISGREVTFPQADFQGLPPDHKRPETLVQFALGVAERGEAAKAAAFFLEAADSEGAGSRWNHFRIECVAAAATLYLEAGDIQRFQETVTRLREELDRFRIGYTEPEIAVLLAIDDRLAGRPAVLPRQIPWPIRDLFQGDIQ